MAPVPARGLVGTSLSSRGEKRLTHAAKGLLLGALGVCCVVCQTGRVLAGTPLRTCTTRHETPALAVSDGDQVEAYAGAGLVYLPEASAQVACLPRSMAEAALLREIMAAEAALGLDVQLAIVLATQPIGCDELFYVPVENQVRGIGYAHTNGEEVFDHAPGLALEGVAFLNDMPYWDSHDEEFRTAFLHEVGHRSGARVNAMKGGQSVPMTGREGGHWSYFLDSGGSPLEGNRFDPAQPLTTATPALRLQYSPLDLYLMGLIEPSEVGPIRLLLDASANGTDCAGHAVSAASPPQTCESKHLTGTWLELGIGDVIAQEGTRVPGPEKTDRDLTTAVFVFGGANSQWSEASCERWSAIMPDRFLDFEQATGARMRLTNAVREGTSCAELVHSKPESETYAAGGGCGVVGRKPRTHGWMSWCVAWILLLRARRGGGGIRGRFSEALLSGPIHRPRRLRHPPRCRSSVLVQLSSRWKRAGSA